MLYLLVVVINEADQLSRDAQAALRRTMEKYMNNLRIILCAQTTSKIISPIRSRCLLMRIPAPAQPQVRYYFYQNSAFNILIALIRLQQYSIMWQLKKNSNYQMMYHHKLAESQMVIFAKQF